MKKFHLNRLSKLATFLETVPKKNFDISLFYDQKECGTVACAAGWAGLMPCFRKRGFKINDNGYPKYKNDYGFRAVEEFFGLGSSESRHLFSATNYNWENVKPEVVSDRIKEFVKEQTK